jgi:hypothetical protein
MKKIITYYITLPIALLIAFMFCGIALASDVTNAEYITTIDITNSGASDLTNEVAVFSLSTSDMITNQLLNTSADDCAMLAGIGGSDVAFMPGYSTNHWVTWVDSINAYAGANQALYSKGATGGEIRYFPDTTGMAVTDNASLEWSDNGSIVFADTYFNSTGTIFSHYDTTNGGIETTYDEATENVTTTVYATSNVTTLRPDAAGYVTNLRPSAGANYSCAGDNSDASYVYNVGTTYKADSYECADLPGDAIINSVTINIRFLTTSAFSQASAKPSFYINSVSYNGTEQTTNNTSFVNKSQIYATSPATGLAWTVSEINNMQIGVWLKSQDPAESNHCAEVWLTVNASFVTASLTATGVTSGEHDIEVRLEEIP